MDRREFLLLLGATAGLVVGSELFELSRRLLLEAGGQCSFCHAPSHRRVRMAGRAGRDVRICNGCVHLCIDIVSGWQREVRVILPAREQPPRLPVPSDERGQREFLQNLGLLPGRSALTQQTLACSFCDVPEQRVRIIKPDGRSGSSANLIAGPNVYICADCVTDAGTLLGAWQVA